MPMIHAPSGYAILVRDGRYYPALILGLEAYGLLYRKNHLLPVSRTTNVEATGICARHKNRWLKNYTVHPVLNITDYKIITG